MQAHNNSLRLKNQGLTDALTALNAEDEKDQTTIRELREGVAATEKARLIAAQLTLASAKSAQRTEIVYCNSSKGRHLDTEATKSDIGIDPSPIADGRFPPPRLVSDEIIAKIYENVKRRTRVSCPCEAAIHGKYLPTMNALREMRTI